MTELVSSFRTGSVWMVLLGVTLTNCMVDDASAFQRNKRHDLTGFAQDTDGKPIAGARIVLIHKSWPNNRFRMKTYASRTNESGEFAFKKQFYANQNSEFLLTVVADGYTMVSDYIENSSGAKLDPVEFELEKAIEKTLVFTRNGKTTSKGSRVCQVTHDKGWRRTLYLSGQRFEVDIAN